MPASPSLSPWHLVTATLFADEPAPGPSPFTRQHAYWLIGAGLVAAVLRFWDLGTWSIWVDEAHTWRDATLPMGGEMGFFATDRGNYPLGFLLVRWLLAVGVIDGSEFGLRAPFAVLGTASVLLLGFTGRQLVGPRAAVLAAWLCAVHPWHLFWSQNARGYMPMFLCSVLAMHGIVLWTQRARRWDAIGALFAMVVGVFFHPTGALLGAGAAMAMLLRPYANDGDRRLPYAAVVVIALGMFAGVLFTLWSPFQGFMNAKDDPAPLHLMQTVAYYFRPELMLAAVVGLVLLGLHWPPRTGVLAACLFLGPFLLLLAVGSTLVKTTARYAFSVLPICLLLAGRCLEPWFEHRAGYATQPTDTTRVPRAGWAAALAGVVLFAAALADLPGYYGSQHGHRPRWREACALVSARAQAAGLPERFRVLTVSRPSVLYYLCPTLWAEGGVADNRVTVSQLLAWEFDGEDKGVRMHAPGVSQHFAWHEAEAKRAGQQFAVIVSMPELAEEDPAGKVLAHLRQHYELAQYLPCWVGPKDESLYVYLPKPTR